jgi:hypothetical protein
MYPFNHKKGQKIQTDAEGVSIDRGFLAHFQVSAENAVALDADGILAATNLGAQAQTGKTSGLHSPAVPRGLSIVGNVSGITGNIKIYGTNYAGEAIDETLALNGSTPRLGAKAFKTITKVDLPAQVHTPVAQVETATAAGTITTAGNAKVTVTTALLEAAEEVDVPVLEGDDASDIAEAIRTALEANENIAAHFDVSGATDKVILTAKVPAANDATLNIAIADGSGEGASAGVTAAASSANTTAGVPYDIITIGWSDILGLPYKLAHNTLLYKHTYLNNTVEGNEPTVTVSSTAIESNTIDLNSALDGHVVDAYFVV